MVSELPAAEAVHVRLGAFTLCGCNTKGFWYLKPLHILLATHNAGPLDWAPALDSGYRDSEYESFIWAAQIKKASVYELTLVCTAGC